MKYSPESQGLYSKEHESDSCGIGFVASIKGHKSCDIIQRGLDVLVNMTHRGAEGSDNKSGDGAGILIQLPHEYFSLQDIDLPPKGEYGSGLVFLPQDNRQANYCKEELLKICRAEGLRIIGWRKVPVNDSELGDLARDSEPVIEQVFVKINDETNDHGLTKLDLERKLYIVRKLAERKIRQSKLSQAAFFYLPSLSSRTFVYKGMLQPYQLQKYFLDLQDNRLTSAIALVHSRFSTNTFPSWDLAQPFRMIAHNGEINTIKGNRFWMQARETLFKSDIFGDDIEKLLPVIEPGKSDSASFDNVLELLVMCGRSLPHALSMMIPESWNDKNPIPGDLKAFYEYHSTFMEPWDGPASIVFTDGRYIGGTLDRNGLRPSRYVITHDDMIVMGSEIGVQSFPPEQIKAKGRLMPGKILLIDTLEGEVIPDKEVKSTLVHQQPYRKWVEKNRLNLADVSPGAEVISSMPVEELRQQQLAFGYSVEDVYEGILPMALKGQEPTGSMGTDTPLAILSDIPQRLFDYFKQLFAQVTNPAIDPIREELVMSLTSYIGANKNLLAQTPEHCQMLKFKHPIFTNSDIDKIKTLSGPDNKTSVIEMLFNADAADCGQSLNEALTNICTQAEECIDQGCNFIVLSDRGITSQAAAIPSLLACGAVHHHLLRVKKRTRVGLIIETGEVREVMHFALLYGYGASAVNPYLALATINDLVDGEKNYIKAIEKGLLKILSKMGVSTLRSYRGSQMFEAVGISPEITDKYFTGTDTRLGGLGLSEIATEALVPHKDAFDNKRTAQILSEPASTVLPGNGIYRYRKGGERHAWNPDTIGTLQWACRSGNYEKFKEFSELVNRQNREPRVLRGLLDFKPGQAIPLEEVESASEIMKRFVTGAMSYGSISKEAHEAMAIAMNTISAKSNSGEGGEDPERFKPRKDGTSARSAIKQVASGRFGVTIDYLANADEIQIKVAQGAKPGEGGQLPGYKVNKIIAKTRHSTPGVTLISPPPHHDIYSIEDLSQLIFDLKNSNPQARISVKLVSEVGVGTIAAGVAKGYADMILVSGYDGGTGASPQSSIRHAGLPWELGLAETQQTLVLNNLRGRVKLQVDGQLKTGHDVVLAAMLGAEEFGFATAPLIVLGCVMMRKCHLNTCPVGVATQDEKLRKRFRGSADHLINYFTFVASEIREIMASLGIRRFDDLTGRSDLLQQRLTTNYQQSTINKTQSLDLANILHRPQATDNAIRNVQPQVHKLNDILDQTIIEHTAAALNKTGPVQLALPITNTDRSTGIMLSGEIAKRYGSNGLPEDFINISFLGSAGQSFAGFLINGVAFKLKGDANDYLGKGLSGGRVVVVPPQGVTFIPDRNIIIGNTCLYGATSGEAYIQGIAGERFCVRNSGADAVVEGTGDHCCEYMTGGRVIVLGKTGRNFAAGMSGGISYVLDKDGDFEYYCNPGMVELSGIKEKEDEETIKTMVTKHFYYTKSPVAEKILHSWGRYLPQFVKVMPLEYKRVLEMEKLKELEAKLKQAEELEGITDSR
ncbi:glutamate synthase large subunit [Candidatus Margulisiibacteriota bacterium]